MDLDTANGHSSQAISTTLSEVYHDVNNPLAVISGNAQLLLEIVRAMDLDDDLVEPIRDIEAASERIRHSLRELDQLKEVLGTAPAAASFAAGQGRS